MIYEPFDWKAEEKSYRAHLGDEAYRYALAKQEIHRREWAQQHGNDSGYDPYCDDDFDE